MKLCLFQHRDEETSRLVYQGETVSAEFSTEAPDKSKEKEVTVEELEFDEKLGHDAKAHWNRIDAKYGEKAYSDLIEDYVSRIIPRGSYHSALTTDSINRYRAFYVQERIDYFNTTDDLDDRFEDSVENIVDHTEKSLKALKHSMEDSEFFRLLQSSREQMPPLSSKGAVEKHFKDYLDALKGRYYNPQLNSSLAKTDTRKRRRQYWIDFKRLQSGMKDWTMARLEWMLDKKTTTQQDLLSFRKQIVDRYASYASFDKSASIISSEDLAKLNERAQPPMDAMGRVLDSSDGEVIEQLETMQVANPKGWEVTVNNARDLVIKLARNNGSQEQFLKTMQKHAECEDFDDAVGEFEDLLEAKAKIGVKETLDFIQEFNQEVHSEVLNFEESIEPPAYKMMVHKQLDYMLVGALVPHKPVDQRLVLFMRSNLEGRQAMLSNPSQREELFTAINLATNEEKGYPQRYKDRYEPAVKRAKVLVRSPRLESPSFHDRAAQLKALIILGHQAEVIVGQIGKMPQYRGQDLAQKIKDTPMPEDPKMLRTGLRFKAPRGPARFHSAMELGGFNTRDLALKGVKLIGLLAVVSNAAQAWSETEGDFVDRIFETGERTLTSHGALAGAAAVGVATMAERDPRVLKFPFKSEYERSQIWARFKLDNMAARLGSGGREELHNFVHTDGEWEALNHPDMTGEKIKELLKSKAKDRPPGTKPFITIQDIVDITGDKSMAARLHRSSMSRRTRYLFYQKFFGSATKPYVPDVKDIVKSSI